MKILFYEKKKSGFSKIFVTESLVNLRITDDAFYFDGGELSRSNCEFIVLDDDVDTENQPIENLLHLNTENKIIKSNSGFTPYLDEIIQGMRDIDSFVLNSITDMIKKIELLEEKINILENKKMN